MMGMTHTTTKALPAKATATRQAYGSEHAFIDPSLFNLFWIFVIASFIGLVGETIVSTFMDGFVKNRAGLVWGPFSPLYGLGAVLMTIALNDFKGRSTLLIFTVAAAVGGGLEFVAGWFWKNFFGIVAWSYVDQPLNFGGYTCVGMMIVWGLAGVAWVRAGIPLIMRIINLIPPQARGIVTAIMAVFMATDIAVTLLSFNFWFERLAGAPIDTPIASFFDQHFGNDWMANRFQTMSVWTNLASHR